MKQSKNKNAILIGLAVIFSACTHTPEKQSIPRITLEQNKEKQHRIHIDGKEFYVKGAGCEGGNMAALKAHGANSFRTWMDQENHPSYDTVLAEAQQYDLKVLMGLEIGRERHGANYDDTAWVASQFDSVIAIVDTYKESPALLAWAIGNEINLEATNLKVFDAVNEISKKIHEIDPNHLTTTTLAGISKQEAEYIKQHCTDIDFLSIQMYGDIINLQKRLTDAGWDKPYMVTEWGATGHWEVPRTHWDVAIEQSSKEKAKAFVDRYQQAIQTDAINCLGSYVFLWGQKQERTPTWYGMFLENGNETETVDAMHFLWNGRWPDNRCPSLDSLRLNGKTAYSNIKLKPEEPFTTNVFTTNYEDETLAYQWEILPESTDLKTGGDFEARPRSLMSFTGNRSQQLKAPSKAGAYRLFVYVTDPYGKSATANIPFQVKQ